MANQFKVALLFGTRPEIIKLSSIIRILQKEKLPFFMVHTGQHYSEKLESVFFKELQLPSPEYQLQIRSIAPHRQGDHTGRMLIAIEEILLKEAPTHVIVQGDTNTTLAGALAISKISTTRAYTGLGAALCHVEAGLRSYDREMPEEINRVIADHLSDLLFPPTEDARAILLGEGISLNKIFVTGNTVVDAALQCLQLIKKPAQIKNYLLLTLHRQENVDHVVRFTKILKGVEAAATSLDLPVIFPIHPRTRERIERFSLKLSSAIQILDPVGYLDFLSLEAGAALIFTDSGGVQEEACILGTPCVTLRTSTERPETVLVGANVVAGVEQEDIVVAAKKMAQVPRQWKNPYGDGKAGERIVEILLKGNA